MSGAFVMALACAADAAFGDPHGFPHPVRGVGALCTRAERLARRWARGDPQREKVAGTLLCATLVTGTCALSAALLGRTRKADARIGLALEIALAWTTLAARDLLTEASTVLAALDADDLALARTRLARIVGRDTAHLDCGEIARATIETLAESACDGIVAPLVALAFGGAPLALAFKAASTLDSMIGHIEEPYTHLGWASARFDDIACFVPARITALALVLCAPLARGSAARAFSVLRSDGGRHRSPNAGRPEAALAGALGVRLGGTNYYDGIPHSAEYLGDGLALPTARAARQATRLVAITAGAVATALVASRAAVTALRARA
jgi:adenosylcobinamide-phosphate synthase